MTSHKVFAFAPHFVSPQTDPQKENNALLREHEISYKAFVADIPDGIAAVSSPQIKEAMRRIRAAPGYLEYIEKLTYSLDECWNVTDEFVEKANGKEVLPIVLTRRGPTAMPTMFLPESLQHGDVLLGFGHYSNEGYPFPAAVFPLDIFEGRVKENATALLGGTGSI